MGNEKTPIAANMVVVRDEDYVVRRLAMFGSEIERSCLDPVCCMDTKRPYRVKSVSADGMWAVLIGHDVPVPTEGLQETAAEDSPAVQKKPWWSLRRKP